MSELADIIDGIREGFDARRELFFEDNACYLLKRDDGSGNSPFTVVYQIADGWIIEYAENRGQFELAVASTAADLGAKISFADAVSADGDVYEIERGDTVPPKGDYPVWRVFCKSTGEKFVP